MQDLIVVGGGEHARVVMEIAISRPDEFNLIGFVDRNPCDQTSLYFDELPRLGDDSIIANYPNAKLVLGVGSCRVEPRRQQIVERIDRNPDRWATLIHPRAYVSPRATVRAGAVIMANASVQTLAHIGLHCIVNTGAIIEHDVSLCDYSHAAPNSAIGGGAIIGSNCFIGLGASIRDHIWIGKESMVGMGAVVTQKSPEYSYLVGCPAEQSRQTKSAA